MFRCGGYSAGTSGGPLLAHVHAATGLGTVIGGCQQGGVTDAISYAAVLGPDIASLDWAAIASHRLLRGQLARQGPAGLIRPDRQTRHQRGPHAVNRGNGRPDAAVMQMIPSDPGSSLVNG